MPNQYPVIPGATRVDTTLLGQMMPYQVLKPADQTITNSAATIDDTALVTHTLPANSVWIVDFKIRFGSLSAAGIRTVWTYPTGTTGLKDCQGPSYTNGTNAADGVVLDMRWLTQFFNAVIQYTDPRNGTNTPTMIWERGVVRVGSTAGAVRLQWAQNVANATGTVVWADSTLEYRQVG